MQPDKEIVLERLPFSADHAYSSIESSIHAARYCSVSGICKDKAVLDIACGEGYGSYLMAQHWGARSVVGVDISDEAISSARKNFQANNTQFVKSSAYDIDTVLDGQRFDLIVSLETIEHVDKPELFLRKIKSIASADATFVISCPNDHYYYPDENMGNPYHFRKYTAKEFYDLVSGILGNPAGSFYGAPIAGFANISTDSPLLKAGNNALDLQRLRSIPGLKHHLPDETELSEYNCSYFLGVWGNPIIDELTMAFHAPPMPPVDGVDNNSEKTAKPQIEQLRREIYKVNQLCDDLKTKVRSEQLAKKAANTELRLLQDNYHHQVWRIQQLTDEMDASRTKLEQSTEQLANVPWRAVAIYTRLRRFIPHRILSLLGRIFDIAKRKLRVR
ncbi:class I SAM-dependent methyltransferase [Brucella anthropi]|jgi:SAM-dependent methyltransferase|uniref:class I SAM-dependent methyltransferase n=1 Tax=Brucella anthropi TaxID=529 RepID=UPI00124E0276|nr:class I SAM-dependent methyltransferase [Brucella anthropi]KAB2748055.1 methyltransferase domain-containing protein [Brucella anthropi]